MRERDDWRKLIAAVARVAALTIIVPLIASALIAPRLRAQAPAAQTPAATAPAAQAPLARADRPAFDVASVKPNRSGDNRVLVRMQPGGLYTATNITLRGLMTAAYQLRPQQLSGLPNWGDSDHFDVEAKAAGGNPERDQINLMVQSLLADRFKLALHHETRQLPIYALVLSKPGKTGAQLTPHSDDAKCIDPKAGPPPPAPGAGAPLSVACGGFAVMNISPTARMAGNKVTMEMLAASLSRTLDRIVVDRTGLTGVFDVTLEFAPQQALAGGPPASDASTPDPPPSIFTAIQDQLGLKLESAAGPVDVLVIDHVEEPSEN
jgi:uncharacterized protein (TIGR03435 family)